MTEKERWFKVVSVDPEWEHYAEYLDEYVGKTLKLYVIDDDIGCYLLTDDQGIDWWFEEKGLEEVFPDEEASTDMVHSPQHYSLFESTEAIEVIARSLTQEEFRGYCLGNLLKYRLRCGKKDDVNQELEKADKYKELYEKYKGLCHD